MKWEVGSKTSHLTRYCDKNGVTSVAYRSMGLKREYTFATESINKKLTTRGFDAAL